ncbi:MAG TPA: 3-hydroxyacyl-CoA dehydrogenase NAD-binding domain-containing protein [Symbiobacteriaceae bacterium]|nr:3-hydroxyacyl-CoA dehydrogenase NAD-binding domain-containing protein [Symbiobacteriaceae bacterium]
MKTVAVCGAGVMGAGIAQVMLQAGHRVIMYDAFAPALEKGLGYIRTNLEKSEAKGRLLPGQAAALLAALQVTANVDDLAGAGFVIEAVTEKPEVKIPLFQALDRVLAPDAIIASNTSGLSLTELAAATGRPDRVVGTHFFNPPPVMKLVELVRAAQTSDATVAAAKELVTTAGKETIEVKEAPLFAVNRILVPMLNEAVFTLQEGIAGRDEIDRGMVLGCSHPIGPLALCDLIGLDTLLLIVETLQRETGDAKYRPAPLLRQMVRAGYLGRKSGRGFYNYAAGESPR